LPGLRLQRPDADDQAAFFAMEQSVGGKPPGQGSFADSEIQISEQAEGEQPDSEEERSVLEGDLSDHGVAPMALLAAVAEVFKRQSTSSTQLL
jgi:hypothetical protein